MSIFQSPLRWLQAAHIFLKRFLVSENKGASAIEFAVIAPVFALILAGSLDLGMAVYSRFQLDSTVSSAASYALVNSSMVSSENGSELAKRIASLIAVRAGNTGATVVVNNGPDAGYDGVVIKVSQQSSNANKCYCPTGSARSLVWGAMKECGALCPDGTRAGKFVAIAVQQPYKPLFSGYGIIRDDTISAAAIARTQ
ncbi:pilus assembly protein [Phyllobacterium salinisoli]|uniref:Pilus assembly protein n=1 Tax=Phyllobacterium salinisoli TaxID=1899321 RepID=A0A368K0Y3_9HYPH|nr:TadE/TadG family type IV pilus assembly protein [Phyllobacterium salinisoli]RCS23047.1 pilus assembly protein [Phyllobacterium salinisoli]